MRVLICDDNYDAAESLRALLSIDRHEIAVCNDGAACVQRARVFRPHVALLDIGMPVMTGYAVAAAIRALDFGKQVLLIAITAYGSAEDVTRAIRAGFDLHITKPADPQRVLRLVKAGREIWPNGGNRHVLCSRRRAPFTNQFPSAHGATRN